MRTTKHEKARRAALLAAQGNTCALCEEHQDTVVGMVYAIEQNAMICRNCAQFKSVYLFNTERGCTERALRVFLAQEPAPEPTPKTKTKKLSHSQMDDLQYILNGQSDLPLAEWCSRAGVTEAEAMQQIADR